MSRSRRSLFVRAAMTVTTTRCPPDRLWRYHVEINFTTGQHKLYDGSVACRR